MKSVTRFVLLLSFVLVLAACSHSSFDPPERSGPIGLVDTGSGKQAWLAVIQEEERSRHVGGGSRRVGKWVTEYLYHLRLQAHDPATAQRLWSKELKVLRDKEGGMGAQIRILGQQGEVVWVWVHDQALALSARDGSVLADRSTLEQANPGLKGMVPDELKFHTWTGALVITLADARRVSIAVPGYRATPYQVEDERRFSEAVSLGTTWNGGHDTREFGVRHGRFGDDWIGLLSEKEARDAENDASGDNYADSADIDDEGELARRTFWRVATTGWSDDFLVYGGRKGVQGYCEDRAERIALDEDSNAFMRAAADGNLDDYTNGARATAPATHRQRIRDCVATFDAEKFKRIAGLEPIAGSGAWLQGRLLKAEVDPGAPQWIQRGIMPKPAVRAPLRLDDPDGVLVLHRTRMDAQGRLALSRVDGAFARTLWTAVLPYDALTNRWAVGSHLLLNGNWNEIREGVTTRHEALVSIDLASGRWNGWDIGADGSVPKAAGGD
ncbi:MAG TPA: PA2928 family protein [Thermomonas sp.]|nr:PA2928 family protein [Thermomonas sp.]